MFRSRACAQTLSNVIGREVQKEVVTVHANTQHNRLRQKIVTKKSDCHKDCHKDQNADNQFPQPALPCKTYRGIEHKTHTLVSSLVIECPIIGQCYALYMYLPGGFCESEVVSMDVSSSEGKSFITQYRYCSYTLYHFGLHVISALFHLFSFSLHLFLL